MNSGKVAAGLHEPSRKMATVTAIHDFVAKGVCDIVHELVEAAERDLDRDDFLGKRLVAAPDCLDRPMLEFLERHIVGTNVGHGTTPRNATP